MGESRPAITDDEILHVFTADSIERTRDAAHARALLYAAALELARIARARGDAALLDEPICDLAGVADRVVWVLGAN